MCILVKTGRAMHSMVVQHMLLLNPGPAEANVRPPYRLQKWFCKVNLGSTVHETLHVDYMPKKAELPFNFINHLFV